MENCETMEMDFDYRRCTCGEQVQMDHLSRLLKKYGSMPMTHDPEDFVRFMDQQDFKTFTKDKSRSDLYAAGRYLDALHCLETNAIDMKTYDVVCEICSLYRYFLVASLMRAMSVMLCVAKHELLESCPGVVCIDIRRMNRESKRRCYENYDPAKKVFLIDHTSGLVNTASEFVLRWRAQSLDVTVRDLGLAMYVGHSSMRCVYGGFMVDSWIGSNHGVIVRRFLEETDRECVVCLQSCDCLLRCSECAVSICHKCKKMGKYTLSLIHI